MAADHIGRRGLLSIVCKTDSGKDSNLLRVPVVIEDSKRPWGRLCYLVRPDQDRRDLGQVWVEAKRVEVIP